LFSFWLIVRFYWQIDVLLAKRAVQKPFLKVQKPFLEMQLPFLDAQKP